jgi:thiol-disulfide isomerase/thioredoxin
MIDAGNARRDRPATETMMGSVIRAVSAGCLLLAACFACADDSASASAADGSPQGGEQLLREVAGAYQAAPAFIDEIRIEIRHGKTDQTVLRSLAAGSGSDVRLAMDGFVFTVVDEQLFVVRSDRPSKYFATPLEGSFLDTFRGMTRGAPLPIPQLALRYGRGPEDYLPTFGMQVAANLKLAGRDTATYGGRSLEQLRLTGDAGATVKVLVDPQSMFIERIEAVAGGVTLTASMSPRRLDRLPEAIGFETAERRRVATLAQVISIGKGDPAPDFTLPTLGGERVTLGDHRGSMVVVDFWATWCGPCRRGLPRLQQFQDWARAEGLAIEVVPVNIGEKVRTHEDKKKLVQQYWSSRGFTMKTLMDYDNTMAAPYEIGPLPHSVVVGLDGTIEHVQVGFLPTMTDHLKQLARELEIPRKAP